MADDRFPGGRRYGLCRFYLLCKQDALGKSNGKEREKDSTRTTRVLLAVLVLVLLCFGLFIPSPMMTLLRNATTVLGG